MGQTKRLTAPEISARLFTIKRRVASTKGAMPRAADEMRREICEEIDDLIGELRPGVAS